MILAKTTVFSQQVKCFWCSGTGKKREWIDPQYCQNCANWNASYRSKVACHICKDTRLTPNRRFKVINCSDCNGSGRDYEQEARNKEFGEREYIIRNTSSRIIKFNDIRVNEGDMEFQNKIQSCRIGGLYSSGNTCEWMNFEDAVKSCQSIGNGWRLPTLDELRKLFEAQKRGLNNFRFDSEGEYWTTTEYPYSEYPKKVYVKDFESYLINAVNEKGVEMAILTKAKCKCVNTSNSSAIDNSTSERSSTNNNSNITPYSKSDQAENFRKDEYDMKIIEDSESEYVIISPGFFESYDMAWMMENLSVSRFRNGDPIPEAKSNEEWIQANLNRQPAWCHYNNNPANDKKYGKLYNWYAVSDPRRLAPINFKIPDNDEWNQTIDFFGGKDKAGVKMKSQDGWNGFSAIPAGKRNSDGSFELAEKSCFWWGYIGERGYKSSRSPFFISLDANNRINFVNGNKGEGFSVRCYYDGYAIQD